MDLTGVAAFAGTRIKDGIDFAVNEINSSSLLGGTKINVQFYDGQSVKQAAVDAVSRIGSSDSLAMLGPIFSAEALAAVPTAQQQGLPTILAEAGVPGLVETGDFIFRTTPPQSSYVKKTAEYVAKQGGAKKVSIIYTGDVGTIADLGKTTFPNLFRGLGVTVVDDIAVTASQADYAGAVSKVVAGSPDAVGVLATGAINATIITQIRQQGYTGKLFGQTGMSQNLGPVAQQAEGAVFAASFSPEMTSASSKKFIDAFKAAKGKAPSNFEAEGYDAAYFFANGLKQASEATRQGLRDGLAKVAQAGFDGALGHLTFENRDGRAPGALIKFTGGKETYVG
jgi:branched-chain amino acid transport system substrate-binding protein